MDLIQIDSINFKSAHREKGNIVWVPNTSKTQKEIDGDVWKAF